MAKKKNDYGKDKGSLFDKKPDITTEQAEQTLYGTIHIPEKRIVGKPLPLTQIHPDARQPRRAIPASVRANAPGADTTALLDRWRKLAGEAQYMMIDPVPHIMGKFQATDDMKLAPIAARLFDLYSLAASILSDGLMYPITVARAGNEEYIIETGERRYLAFALLAEHVDADEYGKIPAQVMDEHSVWRQAQENNNRSELNAIEKARQVAILYMDMHADKRDFQSIDELITPDGCDLRYYQQADGLNARRGYGQRLLDALGVGSDDTMRMYKRLLKLTGEEWMYGDETGAPLKELLRFIDEREGTSYGAKSVNPTAVGLTDDSEDEPELEVTPDKGLSSGSTEREAPIQTISGWRIGDEVYVERYGKGRIREIVSSRQVVVWLELSREEKQVDEDQLKHRKRDTSKASPVEQELAQPPLYAGDCVRTRTGHVGIVTNADGRPVVVTRNGESMHKAADLELEKAFSTIPVFNAMLADMDFPAEQVNAIRGALGIRAPEPDAAGTEGQRVYVTRERAHGTVIEDTGGPTVVVRMDSGKTHRLHRTTVHPTGERQESLPEAETDEVEEEMRGGVRALDHLPDLEAGRMCDYTLSLIQGLGGMFKRGDITDDELVGADEVIETAQFVRTATQDEMDAMPDLLERLEQASIFLDMMHGQMQQSIEEVANYIAGEGEG